MFEIILFFFVFMPLLNLLRDSRSIGAPLKLVLVFACIGVFTAYFSSEI